VAAKLYQQGRIGADETTVVCITGNGLKTTDALAGRYPEERAVKPRLAAFDEYIREVEGSLVGAAQKDEELVLAGGTL
jgi:threonine synthase